MIDYASQDPRSFARWLREGDRAVPKKPLTHPDYSPKADANEDERLTRHSEHVWHMVRLGR